MRISYNWLKEYVDLKLPAEKLAQIMTMSGLAVESVQKTPDDCIFEVEVTSNRPDLLSVIGVGRELSAITGRRMKMPVMTHSSPRVQGKIKITVEDKKLCPRYTAKIIEDVKIGKSPEWLKIRIEAMGLRSVNNVVDITNFCMFETGEPMHAFDLDKIEGSKIIIRPAAPGEKIVTIDGIERTLDGSMIVIADDRKPVAIAGVIGGLATEVTFSTKNILLEAASFDPVSIRRTSRKLGISTESSYRFERYIEPENVARASSRASDLIAKLAGGREAEFADTGRKSGAKKVVELRYSRCNKILGIEIPPAKVRKILNSLGLRAAGPSSKMRIKFEIPGFRCDLNDEIDLIEEVSRISGYDKIPMTVPNIVDQPVRLPHDLVAAKKVRRTLAGLGLDEIVSYSLLSKASAQVAAPDKDIAEIANPLTSEQEAMRPSLMAGMLNSILWNINRKTKDIGFFEIGSVYFKDASRDKFMEVKHLSMAVTGQVSCGWLGQGRQVGFFDLKGMVETLLTELGVDGFAFKDARSASLSSQACASVYVGGEEVGLIGEVAKKTLGNFDIKDDVYFCEIDLDKLLKYVRLEKVFKELPKYPAVFRDISIVVGKDISNADLIFSIKDAAGAILKETKLVDRYLGKQIPDGKVGLTYRLEYQDPGKTLEDKDISEVHSRILRRLEERFGARLR